MKVQVQVWGQVKMEVQTQVQTRVQVKREVQVEVKALFGASRPGSTIQLYPFIPSYTHLYPTIPHYTQLFPYASIAYPSTAYPTIPRIPSYAKLRLIQMRVMVARHLDSASHLPRLMQMHLMMARHLDPAIIIICNW